MAPTIGSESRSEKSKLEETTKPNPHLDASLRHFADSSFDPVDFLNDNLPPLSRTSLLQQNGAREHGAVSLAEISTQTQSLLSQVNAQNARLSHTLTQLTDEILRGAGRLAYEVEILRGETIGLSDTLAEDLGEDTQKFVPDGLRTDNSDTVEATATTAAESTKPGETPQTTEDADLDPEYIKQLRTLNLVRNRLDDVIHTFGAAMEWPLPPSEVTLTSSFISVSAPELGSENQSMEEKGREAAKRLRIEVTELLDSNGGGEAGLEAASRRIESLRLLASVWKGTVEERARIRFVDGLAKIVDERRKQIEQEREKEQRESRRGAGSPTKWGGKSSADGGATRDDQTTTQDSTGGGLLRNLQRLRDEIYLD